MIVTKNQPRIVNVRTGETIPLRESKGMFGHVDLDSDEAGKGRGGFGFCAAEASCSGDVLVRPMLEAQREKDLGDEREVCALDEDVDVGEEEMECEDEELESERATTVAGPDSQAGENDENMMKLTRNTGVCALRA